MIELKKAFSPLFNEAGFEAKIQWDLSRREFAESIKKLFADLQKHQAAIPLPVIADIGAVTSLLAGIDCKGCTGLCCNRPSKYVSVSAEETVKLGLKPALDSQGRTTMSLPCRFFKKGHCSVYSDRPAHCRFYPVQFGGSGGGSSGEDVIIGLDSYCPESLRLGLRVYLTAYDLARPAQKEHEKSSLEDE
jgi:Fe-S-cluster containining protein